MQVNFIRKPHTINKSGRLKVQTEVNWAGAQSAVIPVEIGKIHRLVFEFEMVSPIAAGPFVKIEERNAGGSWSEVRTYYFTATSGLQEISIDFTPTKEEVRLYLSTSDPSNSFSPPTALYFNNFSITDGTTQAIVDGGIGSKVAFKYRVHNSSIGRFLSVDPLAASYPWNSPYAFSENRVIDGIDLEGREYSSQHSMQFSAAANREAGNTEVANQIEIELARQQQFNQTMLLPLVETVAGFTPIGLVVDFKDLITQIKSGDKGDVAVAAIAFIPGGDLLKGIKKVSKATKLSSRTANSSHIANRRFGPFKRGSEVIEFKTGETETFKRVFNSESKNARGGFMMKESDLLDADGNMLSPKQIQKKFALPDVPDKIIDVEVPAGTTMRAGNAGAKPKFPNSPSGGGRQFELQEDIPNSSFKTENAKDL